MRTCGPLAPSAQSHLANTVSSQAGPRGPSTSAALLTGAPASLRPTSPGGPEVQVHPGPRGSRAALLPVLRVPQEERPERAEPHCPGTAAVRLPPTPPQSLGFRRTCSAARQPGQSRLPQGALSAGLVLSPQLPPPQPCSLDCLWLLCRGGACRMVCVLQMDTQSLWTTDQRDRLPGGGEGQVRAELWPPWPAAGKG